MPTAISSPVVRDILPVMMDPLFGAQERPTVVFAAGRAAAPPPWLDELVSAGRVELRTVALDGSAAADLRGADMVIAHAAGAAAALEGLLGLLYAEDEDAPWPVLAVTGIDADGAVADAFGRALARHGGRLEERRIAGFGGLGVLVPADRLTDDLRARLDAWRLPELVDAHIRRLEDARAAAATSGHTPPDEDAEHELVALLERVRSLTQEAQRLRRALLERDAQLDVLRLEAETLSHAYTAATGQVEPPEALTARRAEREHAAELLERLRALVVPTTLDLPVDGAGDVRAIDDLVASPEPAVQVVLRPRGGHDELHACIVALLGATGRPFALTVDPADAPPETAAWVGALPASLPEVGIGAAAPGADWVVEIATDARVVPGWLDALLDDANEDSGTATVVAGPSGGLPAWLPEGAAGLAAADAAPAGRDVALRATRPGATGREARLARVLVLSAEAPPPSGGWLPEPDAVVSARRPPEIAYVLPGLPPGRGGGTHSVVQEARTLSALGVPASVLVPSDAIGRAREVYPEAHALLRGFDTEEQLRALLGEADVAVATEAPSVRHLRDALSGRPETLVAYYVQDYEPLFGPAAGPRSDEALLSYRAIPGQLLLAKTRWLCDVVAAAHGVRVVKVEPSLDREVFHPGGPRDHRDRPLRIAGMIRPRTPRRRPAATAHVLRRAASELGAEAVSFGCEPEELAAIAPTPLGVEHRGVLSRAAVAEIMRWADVFVDLSVYQAFGRSGLEAMACGCVPILPPVGGVGEYARDGVDALLVDAADEQSVMSALAGLDADRDRLHALSVAGERRAEGWSLERAALSLHAALWAALERHRRAPAQVAAS